MHNFEAILLLFSVLSFLLIKINSMKKSEFEENVNSIDDGEEKKRLENRMIRQEQLLCNLNLICRLTGVSHATNVEDAIDKCIEIHNQMKLMSIEKTELILYESDNFEILIGEQLPDFVSKFSQTKSNETQVEINSFNNTIINLVSELDSSLRSLKEEKSDDFNKKTNLWKFIFQKN